MAHPHPVGSSPGAAQREALMLAFVNWLRALRYRWATGEWCQHGRWTQWELIDVGRNKVRFCEGCGRAEFVW